MPLSPDPKSFFKRPLLDHAIDFDKGGWRDFVQKPKNTADDDGEIRMAELDEGPKLNVDISD